MPELCQYVGIPDEVDTATVDGLRSRMRWQMQQTEQSEA